MQGLHGTSFSLTPCNSSMADTAAPQIAEQKIHYVFHEVHPQSATSIGLRLRMTPQGTRDHFPGGRIISECGIAVCKCMACWEMHSQPPLARPGGAPTAHSHVRPFRLHEFTCTKYWLPHREMLRGQGLVQQK